MKHLFVVFSGIADEPLEELDGKTPLEISKTPCMDALAGIGKVGKAQFMVKSHKPRLEYSALAMLGYNAAQSASGRGLIDAAAMRVPLEAGQWAFSCQLVTERDGKIIDCTAGNIAAREAGMLLQSLNNAFVDRGIKFYTSNHGSFVMTVSGSASVTDWSSVNLMPPHEIVGHDLKEITPKGKAAAPLREVLEKAKEILDAHDINKVRIDLMENPANYLWVWGAAQNVELESFERRFSVKTCMVSASDTIQGVAGVAGVKHVRIADIEGKDYTQLGRFAAEAKHQLIDHDLVYVVLNHADRASYEGDYRSKVRFIEAFDQYVLQDLAEGLGPNLRILVSSNHVTPVGLKTQTDDASPVLMAGGGIESEGGDRFNEMTAAKSKISYADGEKLLKDFIQTS